MPLKRVRRSLHNYIKAFVWLLYSVTWLRFDCYIYFMDGRGKRGKKSLTKIKSDYAEFIGQIGLEAQKRNKS